MGRLAALALIGVLACTPTLYVHTTEPDAAALVQAAGDELGVRTVLVESPEGAVSVRFGTPEPGPDGAAICGRVEQRTSCSPRLWSCRSSSYLAHELGHVTGLEHRDGPSNLMHPAPMVGATLDTRQRWTVRAAASLMERVCR